MYSEKEWYASEEHFNCELSYDEYLKRFSHNQRALKKFVEDMGKVYK